MKRITKIKNNQRSIHYAAFGMLESVIAIFITGTIMITFVAVLASMFRIESNQADYLAATNLAQEGIELARNLRDNNLKNVCGSNPCTAFASTGGGAFPANGNHNSSNNSNKLSNDPGLPDDSEDGFKRVINISGGSGSKTVSVTITWTPRGSTEQTYVLSSTLYPWGQNE